MCLMVIISRKRSVQCTTTVIFHAKADDQKTQFIQVYCSRNLQFYIHNKKTVYNSILIIIIVVIIILVTVMMKMKTTFAHRLVQVALKRKSLHRVTNLSIIHPLLWCVHWKKVRQSINKIILEAIMIQWVIISKYFHRGRRIHQIVMVRDLLFIVISRITFLLKIVRNDQTKKRKKLFANVIVIARSAATITIVLILLTSIHLHLGETVLQIITIAKWRTQYYAHEFTAFVHAWYMLMKQ